MKAEGPEITSKPVKDSEDTPMLKIKGKGEKVFELPLRVANHSIFIKNLVVGKHL